MELFKGLVQLLSAVAAFGMLFFTVGFSYEHYGIWGMMGVVVG